jgi:hypothetical protein
MKFLTPVVIGLLVIGGEAAAQVGHAPSRSPYRDLEYKQDWSVIAGPYIAQGDVAGAAPRSGFLVGTHYEWRAGGPAHIIGDFSVINSERRVLNPFVSGAGRNVGVTKRPLYSANVGLGLSLTGAKSWHNLVPMLAAGAGAISDFRTDADSGGFKFGTRFALTWGGGIRWVPPGRWQLRADITNRLYTIHYPDSFYGTTTGGTPVVSATQAKSFWTNNPAFTLGVSRLF